MQEGMEGTPVAGTVKNVFMVLSILPIPITSTFQRLSWNVFLRLPCVWGSDGELCDVKPDLGESDGA
ncbi:hypothetical protein SLA2020_332340 [Shorea laevis]